MLTVGCAVASRSARCARGWVCHRPTARRPVCRVSSCATPIRYPSLCVREKETEIPGPMSIHTQHVHAHWIRVRARVPYALYSRCRRLRHCFCCVLAGCASARARNISSRGTANIKAITRLCHRVLVCRTHARRARVRQGEINTTHTQTHDTYVQPEKHGARASRVLANIARVRFNRRRERVRFLFILNIKQIPIETRVADKHATHGTHIHALGARPRRIESLSTTSFNRTKQNKKHGTCFRDLACVTAPRCTRGGVGENKTTEFVCVCDRCSKINECVSEHCVNELYAIDK